MEYSSLYESRREQLDELEVIERERVSDLSDHELLEELIERDIYLSSRLRAQLEELIFNQTIEA